MSFSNSNSKNSLDVYTFVGKYQKTLTVQEQERIYREISNLKAAYYSLVLAVPEVQYFLLSVWHSPQSITKMSAKYNSSLKGRNAQIKRDIVTALNNAFTSACDEDRVKWLISADLHPKVMFSADMMKVLDSKEGIYFEAIAQLLGQIKELRTELYRGVIKLVSDVCLKRLDDLPGEANLLLSYSDLMQEGQIAAYEATLYGYDPDFIRKASPNAASWSTYVYAKTDRVVFKKIMDASKFQGMGRTEQDKFFPIKKVMKKYDIRVPEEILEHLKDRKTTYTVEDIEALIKRAEGWEGAGGQDMLDSYANLKASPISTLVEVELNNVDKQVPLALEELLTEQQFRVLSLQYGIKTGLSPVDMSKMPDVYYELYNEELSLDKVKEISRLAMNQLKQNKTGALRELLEASQEARTRQE